MRELGRQTRKEEECETCALSMRTVSHSSSCALSRTLLLESCFLSSLASQQDSLHDPDTKRDLLITADLLNCRPIKKLCAGSRPLSR